MRSLTPLPPTLIADRFAPLGEALLDLLRELPAEAWELPTVCPAWRVRDIAAHLLDTALRRLAAGRDGHLPSPDRPIRSEGELIAFLDRLNADWVTATRRLSPRQLVDLLAFIEPQLAAHLAAIDPHGEALFPVGWAGEASSAAWFDVARELTERWLHQQQIRLAVAAPPLDDPFFARPVFDTFLRVLPHRYRGVDAPPATTVAVRIRGREEYAYTLRHAAEGWHLLAGAADPATATIATDETAAWLGLTRGLAPEAARARATVTGEEALVVPFFDSLAVMARRAADRAGPG